MPAEQALEGAIELGFDLPAAPEAVFAAWTQAERIVRWWGADEAHRTTAWSGELRPGGVWRAEFDGGGASAEGRYPVVEPPARLVLTWNASWAPEEETTLFMTFAPSQRGARLVIRQVGLADAAARGETEAAWRRIVGWLERGLTRVAS
jgi:uncharacterized protein YndB with AHSA1/START domain